MESELLGVCCIINKIHCCAWYFEWDSHVHVILKHHTKVISKVLAHSTTEVFTWWQTSLHNTKQSH